MNQADLELEFLIDFPLPRLRFRWGRLGSTRTRAEDSRFFGIIYLDHNFVLRSIRPPVSLIPAGARSERIDAGIFVFNLVHQYFLSLLVQ